MTELNEHKYFSQRYLAWENTEVNRFLVDPMLTSSLNSIKGDILEVNPGLNILPLLVLLGKDNRRVNLIEPNLHKQLVEGLTLRDNYVLHVLGFVLDFNENRLGNAYREFLTRHLIKKLQTTYRTLKEGEQQLIANTPVWDDTPLLFGGNRGKHEDGYPEYAHENLEHIKLIVKIGERILKDWSVRIEQSLGSFENQQFIVIHRQERNIDRYELLLDAKNALRAEGKIFWVNYDPDQRNSLQQNGEALGFSVEVKKYGSREALYIFTKPQRE